MKSETRRPLPAITHHTSLRSFAPTVSHDDLGMQHGPAPQECTPRRPLSYLYGPGIQYRRCWSVPLFLPNPFYCSACPAFDHARHLVSVKSLNR